MGSVAGEGRGTVPVPLRGNTASTKWFFPGRMQEKEKQERGKRERGRETRKGN